MPALHFFSCMKRLVFCLFACVVVGGCNKDTVGKEILMTTDFETLYGWIPEEQSILLSQEQAHSGKYSVKVDPQHEYSLTYRTVLGALHDTHVSSLKLSSWVFVPNAEAQASLVVAVSDRGEKPKDLLWEGINLQPEVDGKYGQWVNISKELTLPATINSTHQLSIYLWRTGGDKAIYLDDVTIQNNTPLP